MTETYDVMVGDLVGLQAAPDEKQACAFASGARFVLDRVPGHAWVKVVVITRDDGGKRVSEREAI